jgi:hypothetical protein
VHSEKINPRVSLLEVAWTAESDQMMALLQESLLKELDAAFAANPSEPEWEAHPLRQQGLGEIRSEMKSLAEEKSRGNNRCLNLD